MRADWAEFRFYRPAAARVYLLGDFNGWRVGDLPMRRDAQGHWTAALRLPTGEYRFRYWADGTWFCDFAAFGVNHGPFGLDSVVLVAGEDAEAVVRRRQAEELPWMSMSMDMY